MVKVPYDANETLADGEFNRFYITALCLKALENKNIKLVVYRAKSVSRPRPESQAKIGQVVNPQSLLNDLRSTVGIDTSLGLPSGPNSGLSIMII